MLRFNNELLSAGIVLDQNGSSINADLDTGERWNSIITQYPSLQKLFRDATLSEFPNRFFEAGRMQRKLSRLYGNGWVVLPHTAGFVDPLHSTGIAFTLNGVENILKLFTSHFSTRDQINHLNNYQDKIFKELSFIDLLVSISYKTRKHFDLFTASAMLYFVASIRYEQSRFRGDIPETFLCAGKPEIRELIQLTFDEMTALDLDSITRNEKENMIDRIRKRIEPFNSVGLINPEFNNMYKHTAVKL